MQDNFELDDSMDANYVDGIFSLCSTATQYLGTPQVCGYFGITYFCEPAVYAYTYTDRLFVGPSLSFDTPIFPNAYYRSSIGCVLSLHSLVVTDFM